VDPTQSLTFPGVHVVAEDVVVAANQTAEIVEFALPRSPAARLSGRLLGIPRGTPQGLLRVALLGPKATAADAPVQSDGTFEFIHPGPGRIALRVGLLQAFLAVDVGAESVGNLDLLAGCSDIPRDSFCSFGLGARAPSMMILGQVSVEGVSRLPFNPDGKDADIRLEARGGGLVYGDSSIHFSIHSDGVFQFWSLSPGEYEVRPAKLPAGYTLKSIVSGDVDIMRQPLRVSAEGPPDFIKVTLTPTVPVLPAADKGTLVLSQSGQGPIYFEGAVPFFSVSSGIFREERHLGGQWCMAPRSTRPDIPTEPICYPGGGGSLAMPLPPGNYDLRGYSRPCEGNCNNLDPRRDECRATITIKAGETLFVERMQRGKVCNLAISATPFR
jgi:hypothetical protein